jgi:hypothetical protein
MAEVLAELPPGRNNIKINDRIKKGSNFFMSLGLFRG